MPAFDLAAQLAAIARNYTADEARCLARLVDDARLAPEARRNAATRATAWIEHIRRSHKPSAGIADLLARFGLTSQEGLALMCLAEALLRIPDTATADALIRDKLDEASWSATFSGDASWAVNMAGWALALTGKVVRLDHTDARTGENLPGPGQALGRLVARLGQPVIREAIRAAMQWMADQFVMGQTIAAALDRATPSMIAGTRYSFDMLGEGARTAADAARYLYDYQQAIDAIGAHQTRHRFARPSGLSVKLSALHPRYEMAQRDRVLIELVPVLTALCARAAPFGMTVTIDAEEGDRLQLSLEVADMLLPTVPQDWRGLGFAVQAYDKRAPLVIDCFAGLARAHARPLHLRLVKGAYWDTEIKRGQERGLEDFSVFTRKVNTDVSYLACARRLLAHGDVISPVFGTHNALTAAAIVEIAAGRDVEFQRLHGMGPELHALLHQNKQHTCIYAPVGAHDVLLGYLVRRILENGANSSFVHRLLDRQVPVAELVADPVQQCLDLGASRHPAVRRAGELFLPERRNSAGMELADPMQTAPLLAAMKRTDVAALPAGTMPGSVDAIMRAAGAAFPVWNRVPVADRAACLDRLADALERQRAALIAVLVQEGGKCIPDAVGELREAVDFCRYYAARARLDFTPVDLPGPTGESNRLHLSGRGTFVCISPWNFPLAIFLGQCAAALVAGNAVVAKPAPQTPRIALYVQKLALESGIPANAFQVATGDAETGAALVAHADVAGVAFTGSTLAAKAINRALAAKDGPIVPLIAETGGQNALIVDSTALPEQVIDDVLTSAFRSAGQRCSALRVLCLPHDMADRIVAMLAGAMRELRIGYPGDLATDVGPVIDAAARQRLCDHVERLKRQATEIYTCPLDSALDGAFVAPQAWEIPALSFLTGEVFGPILHVLRYDPAGLGALIEQINATGFGLTGGLHSRIDATAARVADALAVGNFYVNRSLIGAVVGVQPFGGQGLSGTGPKAGGPHYLPRFAVERVVSVNTTAAGGNASLMAAASA